MNSRLFVFVAISFAGALGALIGRQEGEHPFWMTVLLYASLAVVFVAAGIGTWVLKNDQRWDAQLKRRRGNSKPTEGTHIRSDGPTD